MKKMYIFVVLLLLLTACDTLGARTDNNPNRVSKCQDLCMNEGLSLDFVGDMYENYYCYCEKIINGGSLKE